MRATGNAKAKASELLEQVVDLDASTRLVIARGGTAHKPARVTLELQGQSVFEYEIGTATMRVSSGEGRLQIATDDVLELRSERDLRLSAAGIVSIEGERGVQLSHGAGPARSATLSLMAGTLAAAAHHLRFDGEHTVLRAKEMELMTGRLRATASEARLKVSRLVTLAETLRTEAKTSYLAVRDAIQVTAGRVRERIAGSHHTSAERVHMTARKDVNIDGSEIKLG
jgi:hypothetical protein